MALTIKELVVREVLPAVDPGGVGWYQVCVVPPREFWELYRLHVYRSTGAAEEVSDYAFDDGKGGGQITMYTQTAGSAAYAAWNPGMPLEPGMKILVYVSTHNATDEIAGRAYYKRTTLYRPR